MAGWVFLVGAGASYGAEGIAPHAPPLGAKLFGRLREAFPHTWGNLPPPIVRAFGPTGADFEAGMSALLEGAGMAATQLQRELGYLLASYHIAHPSKCAYVRLAAALKKGLGRRPVMVASLNYDTLIEDALSLAGVPFGWSDTLRGPGSIAVNKPHGSSNFLPVGGLEAMPGVYMDARGVTMNPEIRALPRDQTLRYYAGPNQIPPCMSFFMPGKASMTSHWITEAMQRGFSQAVLAADVVVAVGVRPLPADHHIWDPIRDTKARVMMCCGESEFQSWVQEFRPGAPTGFLGATFHEALPLIIADWDGTEVT